jgi:hypothetical protein
MSGAEIKAQVMEAMRYNSDWLTRLASTALAPCVVLTAEEAERGRFDMERALVAIEAGEIDVDHLRASLRRTLALLTPERGDDE